MADIDMVDMSAAYAVGLVAGYMSSGGMCFPTASFASELITGLQAKRILSLLPVRIQKAEWTRVVQ